MGISTLESGSAEDVAPAQEQREDTLVENELLASRGVRRSDLKLFNEVIRKLPKTDGWESLDLAKIDVESACAVVCIAPKRLLLRIPMSARAPEELPWRELIKRRFFSLGEAKMQSLSAFMHDCRRFYLLLLLETDHEAEGDMLSSQVGLAMNDEGKYAETKRGDGNHQSEGGDADSDDDEHSDALLQHFVEQVMAERRVAQARFLEHAETRAALARSRASLENRNDVPMLRNIVAALLGAQLYASVSWEGLPDELLEEVCLHYFATFGEKFNVVDLSCIPAFNVRCILVQAEVSQLLQIRRIARGADHHPWHDFAQARFGSDVVDSFRSLSSALSGCDLFYLMLHV